MQFIVDLICIQCPSVQHLKVEIMKHLKAHFENIFLSAFSTRLFSVLRFESVIHEFDPYFNYRTTRYLTEEGFYSFHNWFDDRAWYPLGRIIGGTIYPGEKLNDDITPSYLKKKNYIIYLNVSGTWLHLSPHIKNYFYFPLRFNGYICCVLPCFVVLQHHH